MSSEDQNNVGDVSGDQTVTVRNQDSISDVVKREAYEGVTKDLHKFKQKAKEEAAIRAELEVRLKQIEEDKLKEEKRWEDLYKQRDAEFAKLKNEVTTEKERYLRSVKMSALKNELGGKIDDKYLVHADINAIEFNEDGSLNPESVAAAANKFRQENSILIPADNSTNITNTAPSSHSVKPKSLADMTTDEKLALLNRK